MTEESKTEAVEATPAPFVPTKAEDYPVPSDIELFLPSGAKVVVHEPNKYVMLRTGQFPKDVTEAIKGATQTGMEPDWETRQKSIEVLLCKAFVTPKLSMTPKKGHVDVHQIPDRDREFVVSFLRLTVF